MGLVSARWHADFVEPRAVPCMMTGALEVSIAGQDGVKLSCLMYLYSQM